MAPHESVPQVNSLLLKKESVLHFNVARPLPNPAGSSPLSVSAVTSKEQNPEGLTVMGLSCLASCSQEKGSKIQPQSDRNLRNPVS